MEKRRFRFIGHFGNRLYWEEIGHGEPGVFCQVSCHARWFWKPKSRPANQRGFKTNLFRDHELG